MANILYNVVRSNRKSIALVIDSNANLVIRAPRNAKNSDIAHFVEKKKQWIAEKQHKISVFCEEHSPVKIETGESLIYLGNTYTIHKDTVHKIQISSANIIIPNAYSKIEIILWLKSEVKKVLLERVTRYASLMGVDYSAIKISEAKARWGSCSTKGNLNFAWRLILCPIAVIDYVVVHELSHIAFKNHSPGFWARVKTVLPNYQEQQDWLRSNQRLMRII